MQRICADTSSNHIFKISDRISNELYVQIDYFPTQILQEIGCMKDKFIYIYKYSDLFGINLGLLNHETINSPFFALEGII